MFILIKRIQEHWKASLALTANFSVIWSDLVVSDFNDTAGLNLVFGYDSSLLNTEEYG